MSEPYEICPLVQAMPRIEGDELVFDTRGREVRIAGDPGLALAVLGLCDGTRTLTEVTEASGSPDDARALIEALAGELVVVDKTESWRRFHELSSARWGLYRPIAGSGGAGADAPGLAARR